LGMEREDRWVWIPAGEFTMGSNESDDQKPPHLVRITRGFWLGKYPVTNQEYREFVEDGGYRERKWWSEEGWEVVQSKGLVAPRNWNDPAMNVPNQPVVSVNWHEAQAFSCWLTEQWRARLPVGLEPSVKTPEQSAVEVRLPTEVEWEYAARGKDSRRYPWGREEPDAERANFGSNVGRTSPVGVYPLGATPEGALDMAGNIWEWCIDTYNGNGYQGRGRMTLDPVVIVENSFRTQRGGAWDSHSTWLRAAYRSGSGDGYHDSLVGFRIVRSDLIFGAIYL